MCTKILVVLGIVDMCHLLLKSILHNRIYAKQHLISFGKTPQPKSYQYLSTVCGLICACCPAPLCYKEGTIFRRRGPARRENDSFEQDQNTASAARTAPSSMFQSQFLQVSLPPGEVSFQKLKVNKSRKQFLEFSILPKNGRKKR